jgi:hypothetical protein
MLGDSLELENSHRSSLRIASALAANFSRAAISWLRKP